MAEEKMQIITLKTIRMKKLILSLSLLLISSFAGLSAQEKTWMKYITPSGYFQAGYQSDLDFNNTFYIKRARIALAGTLIESSKYGRLDYKVQAELAGSPKLMDYFIKYTIRDEFGIQLGQFKTPLSIENSEYAPLKLEMIEYSLLVQRFCKMSAADLSGQGSTGGREMGLQLYGKVKKMDDGHHLARYEVAIFNGNGINKADDDKRKDFMARLMIYPIKDLCVAGYYMRSLGPHAETAPAYNDYDWYIFDRYGGGFAYDSKIAWLRAEYMAGHTFGYRNEGAYGTIGYKVNDKLGIGFRYDYFTTNSREAGHVQHYYTGGVYWFPHNRIHLQLNYTCKKEPDKVQPIHLINLMTSIVL